MSAPIVERLSAAEELRLDAKAFRENTVYDSDGDPIRLIANAERMERGADTITDLLAALEELHLKTVVGTEQERHDALNKAWAAITKAKGDAA